jgi:hypothetical protein
MPSEWLDSCGIPRGGCCIIDKQMVGRKATAGGCHQVSDGAQSLDQTESTRCRRGQGHLSGMAA